MLRLNLSSLLQKENQVLEKLLVSQKLPSQKTRDTVNNILGKRAEELVQTALMEDPDPLSVIAAITVLEAFVEWQSSLTASEGKRYNKEVKYLVSLLSQSLVAETPEIEFKLTRYFRLFDASGTPSDPPKCEFLEESEKDYMLSDAELQAHWDLSFEEDDPENL